MHKIDGYGATPENRFTEGSPGPVPVPPTYVTADFMNALMEEVVNSIEATGLVLNKADNTQLLQAIRIVAGLTPSAIRTISASATVLATDRIILIDATSGPINLTFMSAAHANAKAIKVMRIDSTANQVSLLPQAAETIAWEASIELTMRGESYEYVPTGSNNYLQF